MYTSSSSYFCIAGYDPFLQWANNSSRGPTLKVVRKTKLSVKFAFGDRNRFVGVVLIPQKHEKSRRKIWLRSALAADLVQLLSHHMHWFWYDSAV